MTKYISRLNPAVDNFFVCSRLYSIVYPCSVLHLFPPTILPSYFHLHFHISKISLLSFSISIYHIFHIFHRLDRFSGSSFPMSFLSASPRYFFQSVSSCLPCPSVITFSQSVASYFTRIFLPNVTFRIYLSSWLFLCFPFPIFLWIRIVFSQFGATYFTRAMYANCQIPNYLLVCFFFASPFSVSILSIIGIFFFLASGSARWRPLIVGTRYCSIGRPPSSSFVLPLAANFLYWESGLTFPSTLYFPKFQFVTF